MERKLRSGYGRLLFALITTLSSACAWSASTASGSAYGLSTDLVAAPPVGVAATLTLGPAPTGISGAAPPDFNRSGTVVGISGSVLNGAVSVSSGTLTADTASNLPANSAVSNASVQNLDVALTILRLQAQAVTSNATATCIAGGVTFSGASHLTGVVLAGQLAGLTVLADPLPNTTLINALGVKIILNEQIIGANQITVSAIHFTLNNAILTGLGVLSGDITVAKSVASMVGCGVPNLVPTKTGPATATVGTPFNYVLSLANSGGGPSSGTINVVDVVPTGLAINTVTAGANFSCGTAAQTVTCSSNTGIGAGVSGVAVATINVTPTTAGVKSNTATVTGGGDNSPGDNTTPPVPTDVGAAPAPNLVMAKTGPGTATVGTAFNYLLSLSNAGTGPTTGTIAVTDTIPASLTINSVAAGPNFSCATAAHTVTCTSTIVINAGVSNAAVATINVTPTQAIALSNTATVSGGGDTSPGDNTSPPVPTDVSAAPVPDLAISKSGPATATVGTPYSYALSLANVGTGPTVGTIVVTDAVQVGVTVSGVVPGPNFNCSVLLQVVTCSSNTVINAGVANVAVATLNVTPTLVGSVSNSATVAGGGDVSPGNDTSPPVTTDVGAAPTPDLALRKSGPATATVGIAYNYALTLANVGSGPSAGTLTVSDLIQAGLVINSVSAGPNFSCSTVLQAVTCSSSTVINAGASNVAVATINVTPTQAGTVTNSAVVAGGGDNSPGNDTAPPITTDVSTAPQPNLVPGKAGPLTATVGVAYSYSLTLSNIGTGPSAGTITMIDLVQTGVTVNSVAGGPDFVCTAAGQRVTCNSSTVVNAGVSGVAVATINVTPTQIGSVSNVAVVAGGGDQSPGDNTTPPVTTVVGPVALPDLVPAKTGPATATVGTAYRYGLSLSNIGSVPTVGVVTVTDVLQAGLTVSSLDAGSNFACSAIGQTVTCSTAVLVGAGVSGMPVATISVTPTQVGTVSNTASVNGGGDTSPTNDVTPPVTTVVSAGPQPDLAIAKSGPATATVGTAYGYAITLANVGNAASAGTVTVTDVLQSGLTVNSTTAGPNFSCSTAAQTVTCTTSAVIDAGTSGMTVATISVTPTQVGSVSNVASVAGGGDNVPVNNTSPPVSTQVSAGPVPDLVMGKTGPATATVGVPYSYQLSLANAGTGPTSGTVTVTDTLQSGLSIDSAIGIGSFVCTTAGQAVTCTSSATIAAGAGATTVATISVTPSQVGTVSNTATVSVGGDGSPINDTSPPVNTDVGSGPVANLSIIKTGPGMTTVGATWAYAISISNSGSMATTGVVSVSDLVPEGAAIQYVSQHNGFSCDVVGQAVTCSSSAPIAAGSGNVNVVEITVVASQMGMLRNQASVSGGNDNSPGNNLSPVVSTLVVAFDGIPNGNGTIPTLSEWALALLALLVAGVGAASMRSRESTESCVELADPA